ncbi:MAG: hypothetical protein MJ082_05110, partial [Clostridia bacterium]|nr:hypothetical protein [Clostridia bacterium]
QIKGKIVDQKEGRIGGRDRVRFQGQKAKTQYIPLRDLMIKTIKSSKYKSGGRTPPDFLLCNVLFTPFEI